MTINDRILHILYNSKVGVSDIDLSKQIGIERSELMRHVREINEKYPQFLTYKRNGFGDSEYTVYKTTSSELEYTDFAAKGGFQAVLEKQLDEIRKEKERRKRKEEVEEVEYKIKKWTYKARYLPFIFSALSLITSIISLIISVSNSTHKTEQETIKETKQTKQTKKSENTSFRVDTVLKKHMK